MKISMSLICVILSVATIFASNSPKHDEVMKLIQTANQLETENLDSAMFFSKKALKLAMDDGNYLGIGESYAEIGDIYVMQNRLLLARENYYQAVNYFDKANEPEITGHIKLLIGNIYATQNDIGRAIKIYKDALTNIKYDETNLSTGHLYNNLGSLYLQIKALKESQSSFEKAIEIFQGLNDQSSLMLCQANLSKILWLKGDKKKANKIILDVIQYYSEKEDWRNVSDMYLLLSERFMEDNKPDKSKLYFNLSDETRIFRNGEFKGPSSSLNARFFIQKSKLLMHNRKYQDALEFSRKSFYWSKLSGSTVSMSESSRIISKLFEHLGEVDSAYYYHKIYLENLEIYNKEVNSNELIRINLEQEYEKLLIKERLRRTNQKIHYKQKELYYVLSVSISIFLLIALFVWFLLNRSKAQKTILLKEKYELEKDNLKLDLEYKKKELTANMMYLYQKNEFISSVAKKLIELRDDSKIQNQKKIQSLIIELNQNSKAKVWEEFEKRFIEVHSDFILKLNQNHADLTPNERKLCAFLRLNMSTKEISSITHQSVKSINVARSRLRKKLNLDSNECMINYLVTL